MEQRSTWENTDSFSDIRKILGKILRRWHWIVIALFWALLIAFLVNRYETPVYQVNAAIITKKFEEGTNAMIPGFVSEGMFRNRIEVFQEIPLLKSPAKILETIDRLDFHISYFVEGNVKTTEVYPASFFRVSLDSGSSQIPYNIPVYVIPTADGAFSLSSDNEKWNSYFQSTSCRYDVPCTFNGLELTVSRQPGQSHNPEYRYYFVINHPDNLTGEYRGKLQINWRQQGSAILNLTMRSPMPHKAIDFMEKYIDVVIEKGLEDKNEQATNTIRFIDEQLGVISDSLMNYLVQIDSLRLENRELINGSEYVFEKLVELDREKTEYALANRYYDYLERYIKQKRYSEVFAPNLLGLDAPLLDQFVSDFIALKMEDKADKNESNRENPLVVRENERTERLVNNIFESMNNLRQANREAVSAINRQVSFYFSSLKELLV